MSAAKGGGLRVVAPRVTALVGGQVLEFDAGSILPEGVAKESLEHLKSLGFLEDVDGSAPAEADGYDDQKVADLKAEIERRNSDRDEADQIPSDGKKAELVAALEADDEAQADLDDK
jgi:hypothetical protein